MINVPIPLVAGREGSKADSRDGAGVLSVGITDVRPGDPLPVFPVMILNAGNQIQKDPVTPPVTESLVCYS